MNVMTRLDFEHAYNDVAVLYHKTPPSHLCLEVGKVYQEKEISTLLELKKWPVSHEWQSQRSDDYDQVSARN